MEAEIVDGPAKPDFRSLLDLMRLEWPQQWGEASDQRMVEEFEANADPRHDVNRYLVLGGKLIGWYRYSRWPREDSNLTEAHTLDIVVAREHQGKGYGQRLMADLIEDCRRRGFRTLRSRTILDNLASAGLHRKLGFVESFRKGTDIVWELKMAEKGVDDMSNFHPRRKDREIVEREELASIIRNGKYAVIGMARKDEPYVVTLSYGFDSENQRLYFHCATTGMKLDFVSANPRVCATIIEDRGYVEENCEHLFSSIIVRGTMRLVGELAEKKHGLDVLLHHLEDEPDAIKQRNIKDDGSYDKVVILSLDIESLIGKQYK